MRLPEIWWMCVCNGVTDDDLGEAVIRVDVLASTKIEAYDRATEKLEHLGYVLSSAQIMPLPERKVSDQDRENVGAAAARREPVSYVPPAPFFDAEFFTKYVDTTRVSLAKEA